MKYSPLLTLFLLYQNTLEIPKKINLSILKLGLILFCFPLSAYDPNGPFLVIKNPHNSGMFAVFTSVLGALDMCETERYSGVKVELDGWYLDPSVGPNWWEYFFEPIKLGIEKNAKSFYTPSFNETGPIIGRGFRLGKERASDLIQRYIKIKPEIKQCCREFENLHFKKYFVIGVHHRGTDKCCECPPVPYHITKNKVQKIIYQLQSQKKLNIRIYVATDEADFLTYMLDSFPDQVIFNDFSRSNNHRPLHVSCHLYEGNYQKGKEALLDCLLLSKCRILIRPPNSSLSVTAGRLSLNQKQVIVRGNSSTNWDRY